MRRKQRQTSEKRAWELLETRPYYEVATTRPDGAPVLRTLNGVLIDDLLLFHGAVAGEKAECLGRTAVAQVHDVVADIPSHFVDPIKGCPATTYFESAQAHGTLVDVTDNSVKVRMFDALMGKYQPEGGHAPFSDPIYEKDLRSVRVFGLSIASVTGKISMGQDRPAERTEKVVRGLWRRGAPGDPRAIERILSASPAARPSEWRLDCMGVSSTFVVFPTEAQVRDHARLLSGQYWRAGVGEDVIRTSIERSQAWVGVLSDEAELLAAARAVTDDAWTAQICDVVVAESWRGRGLGGALMKLLLDHPSVRACPYQKLGTRDAMKFYEAHGFVLGGPTLGFESHAMSRTVCR